jgi:hypothetical protein
VEIIDGDDPNLDRRAHLLVSMDDLHACCEDEERPRKCYATGIFVSWVPRPERFHSLYPERWHLHERRHLTIYVKANSKNE